MTVTIATWNINSIRLRAGLVARMLREEAPDILCLQECKSPVELIPTEAFAAAGYPYMVARGEKGYNGVAILSRLPIEDAGHLDWCARGDSRHVAARLENGVVIHNLYVPAGGDLPDPEANPKFAHKLDFVAELRDRFRTERPLRTILVGDLNIAPREDDVWSHRQLLKIVSHTPVETEGLETAREAGGWVDITRQDIPDGRLYSWWSYRSPNWDAADKGRRLDHIWASRDIAAAGHSSRILRDARGWVQPSDHVPVLASFDLRPA
jgi:exodeoxyribonuclease III